MSDRTVLEFLEIHAEIDELLARHRDLVVGLEWAAALDALDAFERALRRHMEVEEQDVLPLYAQRVEPMPGADPQMFRLEHANILRNLADVRAALAAVDAKTAGRRQAHEFIDKETMLLHLLRHHDLRERNTLYPALNLVLTPEERADLLDRCGLRPR